MLREDFENIIKELKEELKIKNTLEVPRPSKGIINIGIGKLITNNPDNKEKILNNAIQVLSMISGQKPKIISARKSVSGFKLRKKMPVAVLVTLRGKKLLDFMERLVTYVLPRTREFKGLTKNLLDDKGNINLGFRDHSVFPEAVADNISYNFGIEINLVSTSKNKERNIKLWEKLGFPIKL